MHQKPRPSHRAQEPVANQVADPAGSFARRDLGEDTAGRAMRRDKIDVVGDRGRGVFAEAGLTGRVAGRPCAGSRLVGRGGDAERGAGFQSVKVWVPSVR